MSFKGFQRRILNIRGASVTDQSSKRSRPHELNGAEASRAVEEAARRREISFGALARGNYPGRRLPRGALIGVKTIGHWDATDQQAFGLPWHREDGIQVTFLECGSMGFAVDAREYVLGPGDLAVTRPWQRHRVGNPNLAAGRLHWVVLDTGVRRCDQHWRWPAWMLLRKSDLKALANILRHSEGPIWKATGEIRDCFRAIARAVDADRDGSETARLAIQVNQLLIALLGLFRRPKPLSAIPPAQTTRRTEAFLQGLRTNAEQLGLPWTVQEMARACGLGVTRFSAIAHQLTNTTPMRYLNQCRLDLAKMLLRDNSGRRITDVAIACGFSSSQYFSTAFRRRFGRAPREFRRE